MRKSIVAANWKMNKGPREAVEFVEAFLPLLSETTCESVISAPFVSLVATKEALGEANVGLAAQNMHPASNGAFTGEVAGEMLTEIGCSHVILGHSERRAIFGENDAFLNEKLLKALDLGLKPIFCIGETLEERDGGQLEMVVRRQLEVGLAGADAQKMRDAVIAYEPVWAIGTGRTASPDQAQDAHAFVRRVLGEIFGSEVADEIRIQYGGSVKPENAAELFVQPDIDGGLIGGASLDPRSFAEILSAAV